MSRMFEVLKSDPIVEDFFRVLVNNGYIVRVETVPAVSIDMDNKLITKKWTGDKHVYKPTPPIGFCEVCLSDDKNDGNHIEKPVLKSIATIGQYEKYENVSDGVDRFFKNHQAIEANLEIIAKENIGVCEERKEWLKPMKAAVKEYGHDAVLESFYEWSLAQGNTISSRKPVSLFFRNISNNISITGRRKPSVTNPSLTKVEERIAYITENRVFFTGDYRVKLASLLKDYGPELVLKAFEDFFQDVEDKSVNWAARDFLQRAEVMITVIKRVRSEEQASKQLMDKAYQKAQAGIELADDEEEPEL